MPRQAVRHSVPSLDPSVSAVGNNALDLSLSAVRNTAPALDLSLSAVQTNFTDFFYTSSESVSSIRQCQLLFKRKKKKKNALQLFTPTKRVTCFFSFT